MLQLFQNDADLQGEHGLADGGFLDFEVLAQENAQVTHRRRQLLYAGGFQLREQRLAVPAQSGLVKRDVALDDVEVVVELELVHILREEISRILKTFRRLLKEMLKSLYVQ